MHRTNAVALCWMLLSANPAAAAPPPAPGPAEGDAVTLRAGDTVRFEVTKRAAPMRGEGRAVCAGSRVDATGPVDATCERPFSFEVEAAAARLVFTFRPAKGGREARVDVPAAPGAKPVTFVAPSDGSLLSPPPTPFPQEATDGAARKAAEAQCAACKGSGFTLQSFEVTRKPNPADADLPVRLAVTPAAPAAK